MKRGRLLRKKKPLPGMPRSGAHRLDNPNHFPSIPTILYIIPIILMDFPYISLFPNICSLIFGVFLLILAYFCLFIAEVIYAMSYNPLNVARPKAVRPSPLYDVLCPYYIDSEGRLQAKNRQKQATICKNQRKNIWKQGNIKEIQ